MRRPLVFSIVAAAAALVVAGCATSQKHEAGDVAAAANPPPAPADVDFTDCSGSFAGTVPIEAQEWWLPKGGGDDFGHLHNTVCAPYRQTVRDSFSLDLQWTMHDNPGRIFVFIARAHDSSGRRDILLKKVYLDNPISCAETCTGTFRISNIPTTNLDDNSSCATRTYCYQDIRAYLRVRAPLTQFTSAPARKMGGDEMTALVHFPVHVDNTVSRGVSNWSAGIVQGMGWYTGTGYTDAAIQDYPVGPVADGWAPRLRIKTESCAVGFALSCPADNGFGPYDEVDGNGSLPITWWRIFVDPNFHMGVNGCVVGDPASLGLPVYVTSFTAVPLGDCMPPAGSGWHKLVVRLAQPDVNSAGTARLANHKGLLVVRFQR